MDTYPFLAYSLAGLVTALLALYVVLDGFDLGVGIVSWLAGDERQRDVMMKTIGPVWDGNETWLVLLGGTLFGAFPLVYAVVLHALYIPVILMLFGLIFRGVALEFREHATHKRRWNYAFSLGSLLTAVAQGCILGGWIQGIAVTGNKFSGTLWDWATPYSALIAVSVVTGYCLLGLTYLIHKTGGIIQFAARRRALIVLIVLTGLSLAVMVATSFVQHRPFMDYLTSTQLIFPMLGLVFLGLLYRSLRKGSEHQPFLLTVGVFVVSLAGLVVSMSPYLVYPSIKIMDAAAPEFSLIIMVFGVGFLMPVMIAYNAYQYWTFRGKVVEGTDYHQH